MLTKSVDGIQTRDRRSRRMKSSAESEVSIRTHVHSINHECLRQSSCPSDAKCFFKWANHGLFLFIFVLFKLKLYRKTVGFNGIRTRIVGVEGKHPDHLTTTTALHAKCQRIIRLSVFKTCHLIVFLCKYQVNKF